MSHHEKSDADVKLFVTKVAEKQNWQLNSDSEFTGTIQDGLKKNYNRHGYFLCPCRDGEGSRECDKDIVCPCVYAKADIEEYGHCFCALFVSPQFADSGKTPAQIPERRPDRDEE
ncbi:ferredoxin-thioredoxin reductase catalytic domain-containing protein [Spirochaeta dissipatitropha]